MRLLRQSLTVLAYLAQVIAHRLAGRLRIARRDHFQNSLVMYLTVRGSAIHKYGLALLTQEIDDRVRQSRKKGIMSRFRRCKMKVKVRFDKLVNVFQRRIHGGDRLPHGRDVFRRHSPRGEFRFKNLTHLFQLLQSLRCRSLQSARGNGAWRERC